MTEIGHQNRRIPQFQVTEARKVGPHHLEELASTEGMKAIQKVSLEANAVDRIVSQESFQEKPDVIVMKVLLIEKFFHFLGEFEDRQAVAFDLAQEMTLLAHGDDF